MRKILLIMLFLIITLSLCSCDDESMVLSNFNKCEEHIITHYKDKYKYEILSVQCYKYNNEYLYSVETEYVNDYHYPNHRKKETIYVYINLDRFGCTHCSGISYFEYLIDDILAGGYLVCELDGDGNVIKSYDKPVRTFVEVIIDEIFGFFK